MGFNLSSKAHIKEDQTAINDKKIIEFETFICIILWTAEISFRLELTTMKLKKERKFEIGEAYYCPDQPKRRSND